MKSKEEREAKKAVRAEKAAAATAKLAALNGKCSFCGSELNKLPMSGLASPNRPEKRFYATCPSCHKDQPWAKEDAR